MPPATQNTASYLSQCIGATADTAAPWGAADEASLIKAPSAENPSSLVTWTQNPAENDWCRASLSMFPFLRIVTASTIIVADEGGELGITKAVLAT